MSSYAPITMRVVDDQGRERFRALVPFEWELDVKGVMERAFVLAQAPSTPDPLVYTMEYYGYSEVAQYPGYLGYEVESIFELASNAQFYWELLIDDVRSQEGPDSMQPGPGSSVLWQFTPVPSDPQKLAARTRVVHARRAERSSARR